MNTFVHELLREQMQQRSNAIIFVLNFCAFMKSAEIKQPADSISWLKVSPRPLHVC